MSRRRQNARGSRGSGAAKTPFLVHATNEHLRRLGATRHPQFPDEWCLQTVNGPLRVHPFSTWTAMRIERPDLVKTLPGGTFNNFSGKWNILVDREGKPDARECFAMLVQRLNDVLPPDDAKARIFHADGKVDTFEHEHLAYEVWLSLPKGARAAYRPAGDDRPVYPWDYVDKA